MSEIENESRMTRDEAIRTLFELYADEVYRFACHMLNDTGDAKDAVQEVFIRLVRSWDQYREQASYRTFVWRIARNYLIDVLRKRKRTPIHYFGDIPETGHSGELDSSRINFEDLVQFLPPKQKQVVILRFIHDLPIAEIASLLDWPETRVRNTLFRAIRHLRKNWGADLDDGGGMTYDGLQ